MLSFKTALSISSNCWILSVWDIEPWDIVFPGEEDELGPPPSVDEAADALMTRLGFLLGEKIVSGEPGSPYHAQDDGQVINSHTNLQLHTSRLCLVLPNLQNIFKQKKLSVQ